MRRNGSLSAPLLFIGPRLALVGLLLGLTLYKLPVLPLPYYWDEAWVYAPAVLTMVEQGPSLSPLALSTELSRGHPLLFHAMAASWAWVFGSDRVSLHAFALCVSGCVLLMSYLMIGRLTTRWTAVAAVSLLAASEMYLAQSAILLPEMLLTLFVLTAFWAHGSDRPVVLTLSLAAALLTKESGVVVVAAIMVWQVLRLLGSEPGTRSRHVRGLIPPLVALLIASIHFIILHQRYGWFFYPGHTELITYETDELIYKAKWIFERMFEERGMQVLTLGGMMIAPLFWSGMARWRCVLGAILAVAMIKVLWGRWPSLGAGPLFGSGALAAALYFVLVEGLHQADPAKGRALGVLVLFILGYWLFCALNFLTDRYLLSLLPSAVAVVTFSTWWALKDRWPWSPPVLLVGTAIFLCWNHDKDGRAGDTKLSYVDDIQVHKDLIAHCDSTSMHHRLITGSFMDQAYMTNTRCGYTIGDRIFSRVRTDLSEITEFVIIDPYTPDSIRHTMTRMNFYRIKRFQKGPAWVELHGR